MMGWEELKKAHFRRWEDKIHPYHLPMHYEAGLMEIDKGLLEIEEILRDGGMEGLGYWSQEDKIKTIGEGAGALNEYVGTLAGEVDRQIDQPLCKGFQNEATELLSRIKLENYETENTLQIHTRHKMTNEYGDPYTYDSVKKLTFADFMGITGIGKDKAGALVNMPEAFQAFTNMFAMEYDRIKGELANPDGSPVDLESYLKMLHAYGEFDNKMDKPVLEFVSGLLDIIFIKPLAEMCIGYDMITGEDLGDFERGMKGVFAVVDVASMLVGIKASGAVKLFGKGSLQLAGKTTLVGAMSYAAAYGTGKLGEELGLPWPVTLLLSLGAGVTVTTVGSRYVFTDGTGKILLEADVEEVDALRRLDSSKAAKAGVGELDFSGSIKNLDKVDNTYDAIRNSSDDIAMISQNTGMPEWKIKKLKDHIFNRGQILEDGIKRIDPDAEMATVWQRVASGGFDPDDISRLNNEYLKAAGNRLLGADVGGVDKVVEGTKGTGKAYLPYTSEIPPTVQSRINVANGKTRFTPLRPKTGQPVSAGFNHVLDQHYNRPLANSRSIFTIEPDKLKAILQSQNSISTPVTAISGGQYVRAIDTGEVVGNTALKFGGNKTTWIQVFTDQSGNLITTYPIPAPQ